MNIREYMQHEAPKIENGVRELFPETTNPAGLRELVGPLTYGLEPEVWNEAVAGPFYSLFSRGGKRLRPILSCLAYHAFGATNKDIYALAAIPEILHNGTLIIDDIEDNSPLRRGAPAVHTLFPVNTAINAGNFAYFWAMRAIAQCALSEKQKNLLYESIERDLSRLHLGQAADILWSNKQQYSVALEHYLQMTAFKTGALVGLSLKIGAIASGQDERTLGQLDALGESIGIMYQIQDDIINVTPTAVSGKKYGEDITEGKLTFCIAQCLAKASLSDRKALVKILREHTYEKTDIDEAVRILKVNNVFSEAEKRLEEAMHSIKEAIADVFPDTAYKQTLVDCVDFIRARTV